MSCDLHQGTYGEAVISDDGRYRYWLARTLHPAQPGPLYLFAGMNPSTADAETGDVTTAKWSGFVRRWGGRGWIAVNPFAYRARDVRELGRVADPIGPANPHHLLLAIDQADILVPCWGSISKVPRQHRPVLQQLLDQMMDSGKPVQVFGRNADGQPTHPLMLAYTTPMLDLRTVAAARRQATLDYDHAGRVSGA